MAAEGKPEIKGNSGAAVRGRGLRVGLRDARSNGVGGLSVWWLIVALVSVLFHGDVLNQWDPHIATAVGDMSPEDIFNYYGKYIGIGGIAMAGIIGIINSWGIIKNAVGLAAREMRGGKGGGKQVARTQRDIPFKIIAIGAIATIVITVVFFWTGVMKGNRLVAVVGILLVAVIAFLFTTVAANAIAIVGSNPRWRLRWPPRW